MTRDGFVVPLWFRIWRNRMPATFPNAFLGVTLGNDDYRCLPQLQRGKKFDRLYEVARDRSVFRGLCGLLSWNDGKFWQALETNDQHDERAALICALTAVCSYRGRYVAVGDPVGGYFFLPPLPMLSSRCAPFLAPVGNPL